MTAIRRGRRRVWAAAFALAASAAVAAVALPAEGEAIPGSAGVDTSLAATNSQVTVRGRGPYAALEITVNQTRDLVNQAVSVTWKGGTATVQGASRFAAHYLQIFQCWGDDDGTVAENPGPPPEQCVQGATDAVYGGRNAGIFPAGGFALERVISRRDWDNFDPAVGHLDERTGLVWRPFRAVDGTVVDVHYDPDFRPAVVGGNYWLNPYFNAITTNEISGGRTGTNGEGAELFEVTTGVESSGLGCGQKVEPVGGGGPRIPRCWLVVVPRGDAADENEGTPFQERAEQFGVYTSPLSPRAWAHRIAVPLEFNPVDSPCALSDEQRQLAGTELVLAAVASWQPRLCATGDLPPFAYGIVPDAGARQQLLIGAPGSPGMVVVSRPIDPAYISDERPVVYAPLTLSGIVIGFNVERIPKLEAPAEEVALRGVRIADINLTPRLVAKLLTQSYGAQLAIRAPAPYEWARANPAHLALDPDFLRFNPEFELLQVGSAKNFGGVVTTSRNSDAARQVWEWILADPEAKAWLDGAPDEWGMTVNAVYATTAAANSAGLPFADPVPESFPKSDPYCYQAPPQGAGGSIVPPPLCGTDWLPYSQTLREAARATRVADDGARTSHDPFALSADKVYRANGPQTLGTRSVLSLTDSPSAALYGLQTARLSRAGDNGPDRRFVAPTVDALTAGVDAMAAGTEADVLEPDPAADVPEAYPLTALSYAATAPLSLEPAHRDEYAAFVEYAAGPGQDAGLEIGQLPPGYATLPAALRAQAASAAARIIELEPPEEETAVVDEPDAAEDAAPVVEPPPPAGVVAVSAAPTRPTRSRAATVARSAVAAEPTAPIATVTPAPQQTATVTPKRSVIATPFIALARNRFVLPVLVGVALLSALGALEITKRPRAGVTGGAS